MTGPVGPPLEVLDSLELTLALSLLDELALELELEFAPPTPGDVLEDALEVVVWPDAPPTPPLPAEDDDDTDAPDDDPADVVSSPATSRPQWRRNAAAVAQSAVETTGRDDTESQGDRR